MAPSIPERSRSEPVPALPPVEPVDRSEVELMSCPHCGGSNAVGRRRCGRCGRSLVVPSEPRPVPEQEMVPVPATAGSPTTGWDDDPTDPPGGPSRSRSRRRGLGVLVVGLGLVVGTGLGVAAATGVGPFATVEPVRFDPTAYPRDAATLQPATTGSSSTAPGTDTREFGPEHTVDDDLSTAWKPDGEAEGARLRHTFVAPMWITRIEVATGDQVRPEAFAATGRVTEALIDLGTHRLEVDIADQDGMQVVTLPDPVLVEQVTWELTGVVGEVPAITEVRYLGWPADESDREAFRQRG